MNQAQNLTQPNFSLAAEARKLFETRVQEMLTLLGEEINTHLSDLLNETRSAREMQSRRDVWVAFPKLRAQWLAQVLSTWRNMADSSNTQPGELGSIGLSLIEDDSVENKILASRLALRILDKVTWELNDLTVRMKALENIPELNKKDILRPESLATALVDEWVDLGLAREVWPLVQDKVQAFLSEHLPAAYKEVNALLISRNVMKEIDLRNMVKRTPGGGGVGASAASASGFASTGDSGLQAPQTGPQTVNGGQEPSYASYAPNQGGQSAYSAPASAGGQGMGYAQPGAPSYGAAARASNAVDPSAPPMVPGAPSRRHFGFSVANLRSHAENIMGGIKRILPNMGGGYAHAPQLAQALAAGEDGSAPLAQEPLLQAVDYEQAPPGGYVAAHIERAQSALRAHSNALKKMTDEKAEKAIIELVALIFQNIINEERITPGIRIWIARLQMPVLRLALSEPEFFEKLDHPARQLIDHIGSCVLGFGSGEMPEKELEIEIKRIVQVIEQYPETGKRVFELVYAEFKQFLSKYLANKSDSATRMVSLAQQVEEKETLIIKYTIDMRDQLGKMPLRDTIRDFLFKTWSQVLAVSTVKFGAQSAQSLEFKQVAPDLVWATSAKSNRQDRQKAIQEVPQILARLRAGMVLLNYSAEEQNQHIQDINATLTDAFMSKTEPIEQEVLAALSKRLRNLEEYVSDTDISGEMSLDAESIEMVLGIDTSGLNLITGENAPEPHESIKAWINSLTLGSWHRIDHNGMVDRVQFCWRSDKGQLFLFLSADGNAYLFQRKGLAAYLNTALLLPAEEEALTVLATRDALSKLEANPDRVF